MWNFSSHIVGCRQENTVPGNDGSKPPSNISMSTCQDFKSGIIPNSNVFSSSSKGVLVLNVVVNLLDDCGRDGCADSHCFKYHFWLIGARFESCESILLQYRRYRYVSPIRHGLVLTA